MSIEHTEIESLLKKAFKDAILHLTDTHGDQDHYSVHVISRDFVGKSRVEQHKMVFDALQGAMKKDLHALSVKTSLP